MMTPICPRFLNLINDFVLLRFRARTPEDLRAIEVIYIYVFIYLYNSRIFTESSTCLCVRLFTASGLKGYQRVGHRDLVLSTLMVHWMAPELASSLSMYTD